MSEESIDELFAASLAGDREDAAAWDSVKKLHFIGSEEVLDKAVELLRSPNPLARARGADVLGQLGVKPRIHSKAFLSERLHALLALLDREKDPLVLDAAIVAVGHLEEPAGIRAVLRFSEHPDENVRYAVAWTLPRGLGQDGDVIRTLIQLMSDEDSDVRDWATFGLGSQSDADSPEIRAALVARLEDTDEETRAEAVVGLAQRMDLRVLPLVLDELAKDEYGTLYEEAASHLLGLNGIKQKAWESWKYIEELRAHFNIAPNAPSLPLQ